MMENDKYCPKCGTKLSADSAFCVKCGAGQYEQPMPVQPVKKANKTPAIIAICATICVIVIAIVIIALSGKGSSNDRDNDYIGKENTSSGGNSDHDHESQQGVADIFGENTDATSANSVIGGADGNGASSNAQQNTASITVKDKSGKAVQIMEPTVAYTSSTSVGELYMISFMFNETEGVILSAVISIPDSYAGMSLSDKDFTSGYLTFRYMDLICVSNGQMVEYNNINNPEMIQNAQFRLDTYQMAYKASFYIKADIRFGDTVYTVEGSGSPDFYSEEMNQYQDELQRGICTVCHGSGTCQVCYGLGQISGATCQGCYGSRRCSYCGGTGRIN